MTSLLSFHPANGCRIYEQFCTKEEKREEKWKRKSVHYRSSTIHFPSTEGRVIGTRRPATYNKLARPSPPVSLSYYIMKTLPYFTPNFRQLFFIRRRLCWRSCVVLRRVLMSWCGWLIPPAARQQRKTGSLVNSYFHPSSGFPSDTTVLCHSPRSLIWISSDEKDQKVKKIFSFFFFFELLFSLF